MRIALALALAAPGRAPATDVTPLAGKLPQLSSFGEGARGEPHATTLDGSLYRLRA